jgi:hypothetical protein
MKPEPMLYLSDSRGIYIPQHFVQQTRADCITGLKEGDRMILETGPEHEWYWEAWEVALNNVRVTDPATGTVYSLHQDGDLFLVPEGMEWDDRAGFFWPEEETEEGTIAGPGDLKPLQETLWTDATPNKGQDNDHV